jgi:hypothetical protein
MSISTFLRSSNESREPAKRWQLRGDLSSNRHFRSFRKNTQANIVHARRFASDFFLRKRGTIGAYVRSATVRRANEAVSMMNGENSAEIFSKLGSIWLRYP